jgi:hypothetical protein
LLHGAPTSAFGKAEYRHMRSKTLVFGTPSEHLF